MDTLRFRPQCQQPLPANAPEGLCPQCLVKAGMAGVSDVTVITPQPDVEHRGTGDVDAMVGTRIGYVGDYELVEEIARGGMGVVYRARQVSLNRTVALKMIRAGQLASEEEVKRFKTEAEEAANLDHPHIATIYEVGEYEGQHYFSTKLIEGGSQLTQSGAAVGTPSSMAPEQARASKGLTTAVDVYSLGAMLYELATGRPPFVGATVTETILQLLNTEQKRPSSLRAKVDRDLDTTCLKCLEKDPALRYDSAAAMADELDRWQRDEPISARAITPTEHVWRWCRRNPVVAGLIAAVAVSLVIGIFVSSFFAADARKQATAATASGFPGIRPLVTLWDAESREPRAFLNAHKSQVTTVTFSSDGMLLATGSNDQTVLLWAAVTGTLVRTMNGHTDEVMAVAFRREGKTVASASQDGTIRLWDVAPGESKTTFKPKDAKYAVRLAFSPEGTILAAGLNTGVVQLWRAPSPEQASAQTG